MQIRKYERARQIPRTIKKMKLTSIDETKVVHKVLVDDGSSKEFWKSVWVEESSLKIFDESPWVDENSGCKTVSYELKIISGLNRNTCNNTIVVCYFAIQVRKSNWWWRNVENNLRTTFWELCEYFPFKLEISKNPV